MFVNNQSACFNFGFCKVTLQLVNPLLLDLWKNTPFLFIKYRIIYGLKTVFVITDKKYYP